MLVLILGEFHFMDMEGIIHHVLVSFDKSAISSRLLPSEIVCDPLSLRLFPCLALTFRNSLRSASSDPSGPRKMGTGCCSDRSSHMLTLFSQG